MSAERGAEANRATERAALWWSTAGYAGMAVLGIGFAIATRSEAILLDGVYSLVSTGASLAAVRVAKLVERPSTTETFHFGVAHFEPLLNTLRGFFILGIGVFALISAVDALLHDGRPIRAGLAVIYGFGASLLCLLMAWNQRRLAKRVRSPLLTVDARNWLVDGFISLAAGVAFLVALLLEGTAASHLAPYVDPALVGLLVLVMAPVPILTLWENVKEVLQVAPEPDMRTEVQNRVVGAVAELPTREVQVRMVKVGRFLYVLTHVVLPEAWKPDCLSELDDVRCRIARSLDGVPLRLVTDTVFTADARWSLTTDHRECVS